jgi:hypothetical protein
MIHHSLMARVGVGLGSRAQIVLWHHATGVARRYGVSPTGTSGIRRRRRQPSVSEFWIRRLDRFRARAQAALSSREVRRPKRWAARTECGSAPRRAGCLRC